VVHNGVFVPTFATAAKPWVCIDDRGAVPDNPPTESFVNG
jgi:hypothetical protein